MPRPLVTINPELLKWSLPLEKSNDLEGAFFGLLSGVWEGDLVNIPAYHRQPRWRRTAEIFTP